LTRLIFEGTVFFKTRPRMDHQQTS